MVDSKRFPAQVYHLCRSGEWFRLSRGTVQKKGVLSEAFMAKVAQTNTLPEGELGAAYTSLMVEAQAELDQID